MGMHDVMGAEFLKKRAENKKKAMKTTQIWSVKCTKFEKNLQNLRINSRLSVL